MGAERFPLAYRTLTVKFLQALWLTAIGPKSYCGWHRFSSNFRTIAIRKLFGAEQQRRLLLEISFTEEEYVIKNCMKNSGLAIQGLIRRRQFTSIEPIQGVHQCART